MKIALIGSGAMGRLVKSQALQAGDDTGVVITSREKEIDRDSLVVKLKDCDVAIDFSVADAVPENVEMCMRAGVPLVEGTTGWSEQYTRVSQLVADSEGSMVYGANFSIGVNVFYRLVQNAASMFASLESYAPFIEEAHHARKRDAPSGTALKIHALMRQHYVKDIPTFSTRAGFIPGTHRVGFDSANDQILITHTARSREGFAAGALFAARWIIGKQGLFEFAEVMEAVLSQNDLNDDGGSKK